MRRREGYVGSGDGGGVGTHARPSPALQPPPNTPTQHTHFRALSLSFPSERAWINQTVQQFDCSNCDAELKKRSISFSFFWKAFGIRTARQSNPLQALIVAQDGGVNASREARVAGERRGVDKCLAAVLPR